MCLHFTNKKEANKADIDSLLRVAKSLMFITDTIYVELGGTFKKGSKTIAWRDKVSIYIDRP